MPIKTPGKTNEYIRTLLPKETDPRINRIIDFADKNYIPILLPETAAFLRQMIVLSAPKKVLEIGTAIGYSGHIFLANSDCKLFTIEKSEENVELAKKFFRESGFGDRVIVYCGDADEIVPLMEGQFDFIFLDGPKSKYIQYYPKLKEMLKQDGILFCDNVIFNGWVSGATEINPKKASIIIKLREFLDTLCSDTDFMTSILDVGDGVALSIKRKNR